MSVRASIRWILESFGAAVLRGIRYIGGLAMLATHAARALVSERFPFSESLKECEAIGIRSLSLTNVALVFTGMVLALQFIVGLNRFGLELYSGQVVGLSITRELGPVLTAIMVAARAGSGMAAELGSMVVTEQVMAIEAIGGNPYRLLVLPRLLVATIATPLLTAITDVTGVLGGMIASMIESQVSARFYFDQILKVVKIEDFGSGLGKSVFFGFIIGLVSCYHGLDTSGGTRGVGRSTTLAVVSSSILIFIADYFLTKLFLVL